MHHRVNAVLRRSTGLAVAGAKVRVTLTGTDQLAVLYGSNAGGDPLPNPLTTDADGEYRYYVADGVYDEEVQYGSLVEKESYLQLFDLGSIVGNLNQLVAGTSANATAAANAAAAAAAARVAAEAAKQSAETNVAAITTAATQAEQASLLADAAADQAEASRSAAAISETNAAISAAAAAASAASAGGAAPDTTPNAFTFTDVTGAGLNVVQTSNAVTISGIGAGQSAPVTITGGTYSKNGGAFTAAATTAVNGDTFAVRHNSSNSYSTSINTTLLIGGVSDTFTSTTQALPFANTGFGANIAGAEFGHTEAAKVPGVAGTDFFWAANADLQLHWDRGIRTIRLPIYWERLQGALNGALTASNLTELKRIVAFWTGLGGRIIVDCHQYFRRWVGGVLTVIKNDTVSALNRTHFADFWGKLATELSGYPAGLVDFDLCNEPYDTQGSSATIDGTVVTDAMVVGVLNAAAAAIRTAAGNGNRIHFEPNRYAGARHFSDTTYADFWFDGFVDPGNNYVIHLHQYGDVGYAGDPAIALETTAGQTMADHVIAATTRARLKGKKLFLGETAALAENAYDALFSAMAQYIYDNNDVWVGLTWWASGANWGAYPFSLYPDGGVDKKQLEYLKPFVTPGYVRPFNTLTASPTTVPTGVTTTGKILGLLAGDVVSANGALPAGFTIDANAKTFTYDGSGAGGVVNLNLTTTNATRGAPVNSAIAITKEAPATLNAYPGAAWHINLLTGAVPVATGEAAGLNTIASIFTKTGGITRDATGLKMESGLELTAAAQAVFAGAKGTFLLEFEGAEATYGGFIFGSMRMDTPNQGKLAVTTFNQISYNGTKATSAIGASGSRQRLAYAWDTALAAGARGWLVVGGGGAVNDNDNGPADKINNDRFRDVGHLGGGDLLATTAYPNVRLRTLTWWPDPVSQANLNTYTAKDYVAP